MAEDPLLFPPVLSNSGVTELVQAHYPIRDVDTDSIRLLAGYEDCNYYLKLCSVSSSENEYVFKVMNKKDSQFPDFYDALSKLMQFITDEGLTCPLPIQPTTMPVGIFTIPLKRSFLLQTSLEDDCTYVGVLLSYLPGKMLSEVEQSPNLLYQVGEFVGRLSTSLQGFSHPYFETRCLISDLKNFLMSRPLLKYVDSMEDKKALESVFRQYSEFVQPRLAYFRTGTVHNDLNCDNLLCINIGNSWKLSGVIDVMDAVVSYSVFDGAIFIAFMMMHAHECTNPLEYVLPAILGYLNNYTLNKEEFGSLYYLVACHLTVMYLHGLENSLLHPDNLYRARFLNKSYRALKALLDTPKGDVEKLWQMARQNVPSYNLQQ